MTCRRGRSPHWRHSMARVHETTNILCVRRGLHAGKHVRCASRSSHDRCELRSGIAGASMMIKVGGPYGASEPVVRVRL